MKAKCPKHSELSARYVLDKTIIMKSIFKLRVRWSKKEKDLEFHYPLGRGSGRDAAYLNSVFTQEFMDELTDRGYDLSQLKFEIPIKAGARLDKFETLNKHLEE